MENVANSLYITLYPTVRQILEMVQLERSTRCELCKLLDEHKIKKGEKLNSKPADIH